MSPPAAAAAVFGAALGTAQEYAGLLTGVAVDRGLIGPAEAARIWERHLLNCAVVAELVPRRCELVDLGSGAGLPGIVLAIMRPLAAVTLVEPMARRTVFLQECADRLELRNVRVRRGRAEDLAGQVGADIVTARAVARLGRLAGLAAGLARPGGTVLAIKGASAAAELEQARPELLRIGASGIEILSVGEGLLDQPTTVIRFTTADRPRGSGAVRGPGVAREPGAARR